MEIRRAVVADDEFLNRDMLKEILERFEIAVECVKDGVQALKAMEADPADLVITDIRMPGMGGMKLLAKCREKWPTMPVVMMTAYASVESAVQSMRDGAYDYLMKPFGVEQVEGLLLRLSERQRLVREIKDLRQEVRDRHRRRRFLGETPAMRRVFDTIERAAVSNANVLVRGESGTGKELVALALHEQSPRAESPFVKVNCASLTETLLASELFGHERGSFTGADQQRVGRFEAADGGSLLLDEISEISPEMQAKLLRVLEEREFERVGGTQPIQVDVRVIATTNRDLAAEVEAGRFREDLYYRLNVVPIDLPPLRERHEDILPIARHYLGLFGEEMGRQPELSAAAEQRLLAYPWPGNVRELVNIIERLVVLGGDDGIDVDLIERCMPELRTDGADATDAVADEDPSLAAAERRHILACLERCDGDKRQTAELLGISARSLAGKLKKIEEEVGSSGR